MASSIGSYLVVRLFDDESGEMRDVVVPDFWYHDGFCRMPLSGLDVKSEN